MYIAVVRFADRQDNWHIYEAGEQYPRLGLSVSPERIAELAGSDNRMHYPLIKAVKEPEPQPEAIIKPVKKPAAKPRRTRQKG